MTRLDQAFGEMESTPDDLGQRMRYYECLAETELMLLLEAPVVDDKARPLLFEVETERYALVFDREERLADFAGGAVDCLTLSGRQVARMLMGQGIGLGVNLGVDEASILLPPDAVDWLEDVLQGEVSTDEGRLMEVFAPDGLPEKLIKALDRKLAGMVGLAQSAWLVRGQYETGAEGYVLGFVAAQAGAEAAMASAVSEVLKFSTLEAAALDVAFFKASDALAGRLAKVGLRFDLPQVATPTAVQVRGSDPERPPKLR